MKIFSAAQIKEWDAYTIANESVTSFELMERAATACFNWMSQQFKNNQPYIIFCGTGNNGGDGLALARMLLQAGKKVAVYVLDNEKKSHDFTLQLTRLKAALCTPFNIDANLLPAIPKNVVVVDALFGTGLSRPLEGVVADLVTHINLCSKTIISIDLPSGLFADTASTGHLVVWATHTISFQVNKLAFFMAENNQYTGAVYLADIGLHPQFYNDTVTRFNTLDLGMIQTYYKPRNQFLHKYNFGHALLYAGSKNMMGAAILCAKACLRSGAGLVTVYTEANTGAIIQTALPEAITSNEEDIQILMQKKSAIGIGPGLRVSTENAGLLDKLIADFPGPIVVDATALQLLAANKALLTPARLTQLILTPHTGEFEKLFGKTNGDFERMEIAMQQAVKLGCYIIVKGHYTLIACPDGTAYFNTTGNAGMATAGSGDVLTGLLTGLAAQGYPPKTACMLGVFLHGMAGDIAAVAMSQEAMIAGDIIDAIGSAFKTMSQLPGA